MIVHLCDHLAVPLRERNQVLLSAGFAPAYPEHSLGDPPMMEANAALEALLAAQSPCPALVIDRHWDLVTANAAAFALLDGVDADVLEPPVNVVRLTLHERGLARRIVNFDEWRAQLAARLRREFDISADPEVRQLLDEATSGLRDTPAAAALVVPLRLRRPDGHTLSFISTTTVFGTPREVTLSELAIETFYPADDATRALLGSR